MSFMEEVAVSKGPPRDKRDDLGLTIEDWILALLAYGGGEIRGKTRLQKTLFIIDRLSEKYDSNFVNANFRPYDYGPHSVEVEKALKDLRRRHLIDIDYESTNAEEPVIIIKASPEAIKKGKKILDSLKKSPAWKDIDARMYFGLKAPLLELLWYVYEIWPEYTSRSMIKYKLRLWGRKKRLFPENYNI